MMWWPGFGWGFGGGAMIIMMLFMAVFWILIIVGAILLIRWMLETGGKPGAPTVTKPVKPKTEEQGESPLDILKKRYALGEIDKKEYEEKKKELEEL